MKIMRKTFFIFIFNLIFFKSVYAAEKNLNLYLQEIRRNIVNIKNMQERIEFIQNISQNNNQKINEIRKLLLINEFKFNWIRAKLKQQNKTNDDVLNIVENNKIYASTIIFENTINNVSKWHCSLGHCDISYDKENKQEKIKYTLKLNN